MLETHHFQVPSRYTLGMFPPIFWKGNGIIAAGICLEKQMIIGPSPKRSKPNQNNPKKTKQNATKHKTSQNTRRFRISIFQRFRIRQDAFASIDCNPVQNIFSSCSLLSQRHLSQHFQVNPLSKLSGYTPPKTNGEFQPEKIYTPLEQGNEPLIQTTASSCQFFGVVPDPQILESFCQVPFLSCFFPEIGHFRHGSVTSKVGKRWMDGNPFFS